MPDRRQDCLSKVAELPGEGEIAQAVAIFAALAHPVRLLVLSALSRRGPMSVGELQKLAGIEQSAMSHQLRTLRTARLIDTERRGRHIFYHLSDHHVAHIVEDAIAHIGEP